MCNMKALSLLVRKSWPRLKFFKSRSNFKVKVTRYMKALSLPVRKSWPRLKFFKSRSNFKVKVTRSKTMVPFERFCHKEYTCAI